MADVGGSKERPVVIVSREDLNRGKYVVAIPFTSAKFEIRSLQPNCVPFHTGEFGLTKDCIAQAEAISFIEIDDLNFEEGLEGSLDEEKMREIIKSIGYLVAADCEPL